MMFTDETVQQDWICPICGTLNIDFPLHTVRPLCGFCETDFDWSEVKPAPAGGEARP